MRRALLRFTLLWVMTAVAIAAIVLGIAVAGLRWYLYPHIDLTVFNESSMTIYALHVSFLTGERTAEELKPGGVAATEIQSGGDAAIFFSYQDTTGVLRKVQPLYSESGNRGFLEVHITNEGERLVNGIYALDTPSIWSIRVKPAGQMIVR